MPKRFGRGRARRNCGKLVNCGASVALRACSVLVVRGSFSFALAVSSTAGVSSSAVAPAITWMALTKNSVVMRASRFVANPRRRLPGMTTTEGSRVAQRRRIRPRERPVVESRSRSVLPSSRSADTRAEDRRRLPARGPTARTAARMRVRRKWSGSSCPSRTIRLPTEPANASASGRLSELARSRGASTTPPRAGAAAASRRSTLDPRRSRSPTAHRRRPPDRRA